MAAVPAKGLAAGDAALWRADLTLVLARTLAVLFLVPAVALLASRTLAGRPMDAAIGLVVYGLLVLAAANVHLTTTWRVAAVLGVLTALTLNIILERGLGLTVGPLAGTFALLTLLAWGRTAAALAVGAWLIVFAVAAAAMATGSLAIRVEQDARSVMTTIVLWAALTMVGIVTLSSVVARLEDGVRHADELGRRLRSEAHERLALALRLLSEEEALRGTLARELHDDIGQRLTAIKITLETATLRRQDTLDVARRESVRQIQDLLRHVSTSSNLQPPTIENGLAAAVEALVRKETQRAGITGTVDIPETSTVRDDAQMPCYRIVQEALTNAIRHAGARTIVVRATRVEAGVLLVVRDDGVGFDVDVAQRQGLAGERLGLVGMRERAEGIGADLNIVSARGMGTEIRLVVPDERVA